MPRRFSLFHANPLFTLGPLILFIAILDGTYRERDLSYAYILQKGYLQDTRNRAFHAVCSTVAAPCVMCFRNPLQWENRQCLCTWAPPVQLLYCRQCSVRLTPRDAKLLTV